MPRATRKDLHERTRRGRELTERNRAQLIESECTLASTMYDLAITEFRVGDRAHGFELLGKVKDAIQGARASISQSHAPPQQLAEVSRQLVDLERRIRDLERKVA